MPEIRIETIIDRTPEQVWDYLKDISSHVDWMADAAKITFTGDQTSGVGTSFECLTKVGPLKTTDVMTITSWEPNKRMGVTHSGLVTGIGEFVLHESGERQTLFVWQEGLKFPALFLGPIGAYAAKPILKLVWRRNLRNLKTILET